MAQAPGEGWLSATVYAVVFKFSSRNLIHRKNTGRETAIWSEAVILEEKNFIRASLLRDTAQEVAGQGQNQTLGVWKGNLAMVAFLRVFIWSLILLVSSSCAFQGKMQGVLKKQPDDWPETTSLIFFVPRRVW